MTGVGIVSPLGIGTEANWDALCAGRSGIGMITHFDASQFSARIAGQVKDFDPLRFIDKKDVKKMDVFIQFAIASSQFAMDDAGLSVTEDMASRVGVFIASGIGGFGTIERERAYSTVHDGAITHEAVARALGKAYTPLANALR